MSQKLCLIGSPIAHSKSPIIHNSASQLLNLDYIYDLHEATIDTIEEVVNELKKDYVGWNVTMPTKNAMCNLCDELSDVSRLTGAVNTVVNRNGKLYGTTTDGVGFLNSMKEEGIDPTHKIVTILGAGGASTAVYVQCAYDGVKEINIFNRKASKNYKEAKKRIEILNKETNCTVNLYDINDHVCLKQKIQESYLLINGTSVGMAPNDNAMAIPDASYLHPDLIVADLIYNPRCTKLLQTAKEGGCLAVNGEGMLLHQAAVSYKLWTGVDMPVEILKKQLNINIRV